MSGSVEVGVVGRFVPAGNARCDALRFAFAGDADGHWSDGTVAIAWSGAAVLSGPGEVTVIDGDAEAARLARRAPAPYAPGDEAWLERGFAGIDWSEARREGVLICDPSGGRELFLLQEDGALLFATALRLLLQAAAQPPRVDRRALACWLATRPLGLGRTLYERVVALPSGHRIALRGGGWRTERFWRPRPRPDLGGDDPVHVLRNAVVSTVDRCAEGARAPAVLLSGGLDSGTVTASLGAATRHAGRPAPSTFSGVFPDHPELDESRYIDAVVAGSGAGNVKVPLTGGELIVGGEAYRDRNAQPADFPGGLTFLPVARRVSQEGHDLLLDGEGGDELFGCEPVLIADLLLRGRLPSAARVTREIPGMGDRMRARALRVVGSAWLLPAIVPPRAWALVKAPRDDRPGWLRAPLPERAPGEPWRRRLPLWRSRREWMLTTYRDATGTHRHVRGIERIGGVPAAHPFHAASLTEVVLALPPERAFDRRDDRALLREAMRGLLAEPVLRREDKTYFQEPVIDSLTGAEHDIVARTLEGRLALEGLVDAQALRALVHGGPDAHPRSRWRWALEVWRAYAAESWLAQQK